MSERDIPDFVRAILHTLENAGYEAWLVGGCVRDMRLGRQPSDYDIATAAAPDETARLFEKTVPTGVRYGTVTVLTGGGNAEVTTFRGESGYADSRRPSQVVFGVGIAGDLARRDFTVNAMALHPERGLFDPYDGAGDLRRRCIRAVGDPETRFAEDALRILRAYRFAAQLGFGIDEATGAAAREAMAHTANLSGERIRAELERILLSPRPSFALRLADDGLFVRMGIAAHAPASDKEGAALGASPVSLRARWAAFLALTGLPADRISARLKFDGRTRRDVRILLCELQSPPPAEAVGIRRRLKETPPPLFDEYLRLYAALQKADTTPQRDMLAGILTRHEAYTRAMLAVNGADLRAAGIEPGPGYARALDFLLDRVIEDPQANRRPVLLDLLRCAGGLFLDKSSKCK